MLAAGVSKKRYLLEGLRGIEPVKKEKSERATDYRTWWLRRPAGGGCCYIKKKQERKRENWLGGKRH